ncbi:MAG: phosphate ABC transporter ATP-binding protein PstB [Canidatus Methanoxibalbensis ujae]|nr:phosphate ABC transporter ATP-binding protein PstB [Candidatus Methanoxibalbensis ujae]MCW7078699.1 phosphate ABC transporter ATP-binding protein PstB [Candidatus Methanoxibalbensis ujae]
MSEMAVKVETYDLNVYYGNVHALKGVSVRIDANNVTAVIGPSGCGKTTFLRVLNRLVDLDGAKVSGNVYLDGEDILNGIDVTSLRRRVGMVFQQPNPFPMSIYNNVAFGPRIHGIRDKRSLDRIVELSLKKAALWDEVKDRLYESALRLSGGQQQRLCIARALAVQPEVILFDEPCSALDPVSTAKIEELIRELRREYTIIIVTHNMHQAARISDYTAFFLNGELIEFDKTPQIFGNPQDRRTEAYINGIFG